MRAFSAPRMAGGRRVANLRAAPVARAMKDDNLGFKTMRKGVKEAADETLCAPPCKAVLAQQMWMQHIDVFLMHPAIPKFRQAVHRAWAVQARVIGLPAHASKARKPMPH